MSANANPRISVCIANYNGEYLLVDCIDSVLAQGVSTLTEIIVHDDASTDGSLALLRERYPEVRVIPSSENVGFCIANNRMVEAARGEFVLLLNNDAALMPDALCALLDDAAHRGDGAILTLPQYDWMTGVLVDRGCLLDPFHVPVPNLDPEREDVAYVIGACLWIPRECWSRLGGFPDWFGSIAEDMYLCCAARLQGTPVRCLNRNGYRHRQGASFGGNRADAQGLHTRYRRRYLSERNRLSVLAITMPSMFAWPWLLICSIALSAEGALLTLAKTSLRPWREIYAPSLRDTWHERSLLKAQRRRLQAMRCASLRTYLYAFTWMPRKLQLLVRHGFPQVT
ncbi:glycosyltransferase family 2 protein [Luteimonas kalidii]|uniref:Glycosyltransferase n=1 Tax=Luteimonas kalidii TaxID=3042025 RepID=A0ABT6JR98_9GAMM|nr:glycosyltransferase [Luteimonas kalidii]MDH5833040.1 glycosyltransferase [Luteimonas kalidii]